MAMPVRAAVRVSAAMLVAACGNHGEPAPSAGVAAMDRAGRPGDAAVAASDGARGGGTGEAAGVVASDGAGPLAVAGDAGQLDCSAAHSRVDAAAMVAWHAMDNPSPIREARLQWTAMPPACRNGRWYLQGALLLELAGGSLDAGDIELESSAAALGAALAQPDDLDVLMRVAFESAIGKQPKLPIDACERAHRTISDPRNREQLDGVAYVCARAAIVAGDGEKAKREVDALTGARVFVDADLLLAQIARLRGDREAMKAHAKNASQVDARFAFNMQIDSADRLALIAIAKQLMR